MKYILFFITLIWNSNELLSQNSFPGLTAQHIQSLKATQLSIPLPTYLPNGFVLDTIITENIEYADSLAHEKILYIQYTRPLNDGSFQSFYIDAGFDGLGSLWYNGDEVETPIGSLYLYYQPFEQDENGNNLEQVTDLIGTEWFEIDNLNFHVFCIVSFLPEGEEVYEEDDMDLRTFVPIEKEEFIKILKSLKILYP